MITNGSTPLNSGSTVNEHLGADIQPVAGASGDAWYIGDVVIDAPVTGRVVAVHDDGVVTLIDGRFTRESIVTECECGALLARDATCWACGNDDDSTGAGESR